MCSWVLNLGLVPNHEDCEMLLWDRYDDVTTPYGLGLTHVFHEHFQEGTLHKEAEDRDTMCCSNRGMNGYMHVTVTRGLEGTVMDFVRVRFRVLFRTGLWSAHALHSKYYTNFNSHPFSGYSSC